MKYKVNSKMPLQQNEQRHKQILAKYMPSSGNNSNIQYSCPEKPVYFFPPQEGRAWERGCHLCRISELLQ
jgi:hypothetical protein